MNHIFQLGSLLSIYGCHRYLSNEGGDRIGQARLDSEQGIYAAPISERNENARQTIKNYVFQDQQSSRKPAGFWGHVFQIIYQVFI